MPLSRITNPFLGTSGYRSVTDFTATAGQTSFTVPSYAVGYIDVYRNGVKLAAADFTATSGTTVVLANPATLGDVITTISTYMGTATNLSVTGGTINGQLVVNSATGVNPFITQVNSTEVLRIDSSGNVGVGTTAPVYRLHVLNSTNTATASDNCGVLVSSTNRTGFIQLDSIDGGTSSVVFSTVGTEVGRVLYNNLNNYMAFRTNGSTERMRIDSSGNVGIGTLSPSTKLDVTGPSGATSFTGTSSLGVTVRGGTSITDYSGIDFRNSSANTGSNAIARIGVIAASAGSSMNFGTSNTYVNGVTNTAMSINPSGNVQFASSISVGNVTPTTSGFGITFPATQSASSDANTLDDYEEGSWTPSVGGTATYTAQSGRYTKIGNKVFIEGIITINTIGTGSVGDISGLPFTTNASSPLGSISVGYYSVSATSITYISATLALGQNNINLRVAGNAGGSMGAVTFFQNSASIYFTGQYTA
jgi:hypothetical protein